MPAAIRSATRADADALVALGLQFLTAYQGGSSGGGEDPARARAVVESVLEHGVACVIDDRGAIIGMLGVLVGPHPITGLRTGFEVAWYIDPQYRGRRQVLELVTAAEQAARARGAQQFQIGAPNAAVGHFLARLDYRPVETTYVKALA